MLGVSCSGGLASRKQAYSGAVADTAAPSTAAYGAAPAPQAVALEQASFNTEAYDRIDENDFVSVVDHPLSTFSIDVDTASYSNVRRFLQQGKLPPADAVRIEELINYFGYEYPEPTNGQPFSVTTEVGACPWNEAARLVHVGLQGRRMSPEQLPPRNLVFLFDVSGSMSSPDKLPLLKTAFGLLVDQLDERDRIAIVVYAGASGVVLPPTSGNQKSVILEALQRLQAGGSTNGGQGIRLAYALAEENFDASSINRVILATDGDFNVGVTDRGSLSRLIEEKRKTGVYLTVLGFGSGNLKDSQMEELADRGNGNYAYIDSINEARKVLVNEAGSTLVTIAKDVKIQVEFNPAEVSRYRLIGYENRLLKNTDFNDDSKDAGEIGAGHTVTALYEVIPGRADEATSEVDPLAYQGERAPVSAPAGELMTVKLRFKRPDAYVSEKISRRVVDEGRTLNETSDAFRFAAAVAGFGMLLRESKHRGNLDFAQVEKLARTAIGADPHGYRKELISLVDKARALGSETAPKVMAE